MINNFISEFYNAPMLKSRLRAVENFLIKQELSFDKDIEFTACIYAENGELAATGSLQKNILKCIAVDEKYRGEGLTATLVSALKGKAFENGEKNLLLFTKPKNKMMFSEFGFFELTKTADMLLMESPHGVLDSFISSLEKGSGVCGAVVANCNPFTNGHRYLIETASKNCDTLHLFVLSEDKSLFSADTRMELVKKGVADLKNVLVHKTSDYLVSSATFPTYFLKEEQIKNGAGGALDLKLFGEYFVPALNIKKRFVGSEPYSAITALYNKQMHEILPEFGVEVVEIERKEFENSAISASRVRKLLEEKSFDEIAKIVPQTTLDYIKSNF